MIYQWTNAEKTIISGIENGDAILGIPADPQNVDYVALLASGESIADYVEPPTPAELTLAEKIAAAGIDLDELKALLAA